MFYTTMVVDVFYTNVLTYTNTRRHFADVMRQVNDDHEPVMVTSQRGKPVVIISLSMITKAWKRLHTC
jgi:prevent-host-death family protein